MVKEEIQEIWKDVKEYEKLYQVSNLGRVRSLDKMVWNGQNYWKMKGKILKQSKDKDGYLLIGLHLNGKVKNCKVHRLVAIHFIPNPNNLPEVNHKKGNKEDNRFFMLEWCTRKENDMHAIKTGLKTFKKGEENPLFGKYKGANNPMFGKHHSEETKTKISKKLKGKRTGKENPFYGKHHSEERRKLISELTSRGNNPKAKKVKCITTGKIFDCIVDGAEYYNIKNSTDISACCRGRQKSAGKHPVTGEKLKWKYLEDSE